MKITYLFQSKTPDLFTSHISYIFLLITSYNKLYLKAPSEMQHKSYNNRETTIINQSPQTRRIEIYLLEFKKGVKSESRNAINSTNSFWWTTDPRLTISPIIRRLSFVPVQHGCVHVHPSKTYCIFNMISLSNQLCVYTLLKHTDGPMTARNTHTHIHTTDGQRVKYAMVDWKKYEHQIRSIFLY